MVMKRNVLIIGNSAKEAALARILSRDHNVFAAPGNDGMKQFAQIVDIRESNVPELVNFALENDIFFTVVCSDEAIKANIYDIFNSNGLCIFSPECESAQFTLSRSIAKKMFYKLRIPTPKFAVYEKKQLALDYVQKCEMPIVIKTESAKQKNSILVCPSVNIAKAFIEDCFFSGEQKVIIEEFVLGEKFSFYIITDGYKALPIGSTLDYRFSLEGGGGVITDGMGSCSPFLKLTYDDEDYLMNDIVYPIINYLASNRKPYSGIFGLEGVLTPENDIAITECTPFLKDHDAQGVLSLIGNDIFNLLHSCAIGSFSDEYEILDFKDECSVSCVLSSGQTKGEIIQGLDELQEDTLIGHINTKQNEYTEFETMGGRTLVVTTIAKTMGRAAEKLYNEIGAIEFRGKTYRKDICRVPLHLGTD